MSFMLDNPRVRFWFLAIILVGVIVWALKPMLTPFVAGLTIAYFLNPVVNKLCQSLKTPRWFGTLAVLAFFITAVCTLLLLIAPVLQDQIISFIHALPDYVDTARASLQPIVQKWLTQMPTKQMDSLRDATTQYAGTVVSSSGKIIDGIVTSGAVLVKAAAYFVITFVVAFFLLRDFPLVAKTVDDLIPRKHYALVREQLGEIDKTLSGFIRGQALVCTCLGSIYGIGLTLAGLKYGATLGLVGGILSFIPYVGSTFVFVASTALAFVQFDSLHDMWPVFAVFLTGQTLEGYFLTPVLVGDRVNLHPVWILFAIFAGASLMGFLGVLIAVPVASMLGVLIRFALKQYRLSSIYSDPLAPRERSQKS